MPGENGVDQGSVTLHILLSLVNHKGIACMRLLFLFLRLARILIFLVGIRNNTYLNLIGSALLLAMLDRIELSHPLNRSVSTEFPLQIRFFGIVTQSSHEKGLECIASDLWILTRLIYIPGEIQS